MARNMTNSPSETTGRTPDGYKAKLLSDPQTPRLLVEGKFDRLFFEKLIDHLIAIRQYPNKIDQLEKIKASIDIAENLDVSGGHRDRVESICFIN